MLGLNNCRNNTKDNEFAPLNNIKNELDAICNNNREFDNVVFESVGGRLYQNNLVLLEGDVLFSIIRKQWKQVEQVVLADMAVRNTDVSDIRKQVLQVLLMCRYSIQQCGNRQQGNVLRSKLLRYLKLLKSTISTWTTLEERSLAKLTSSSVRDNQLPVYYYFHMYMDVQWLILTLSYICEEPLETFEKFIKDLVIHSFAMFKKHGQKEILQENPFLCTCIKRQWILLQLFNEKLFKKGLMNKNFWEMFNNALSSLDGTFALWLLHHVGKLHGYTDYGEFIGPINIRVCENYSLIDSKLKYLNVSCINITNDNNEMLLNYCRLIDPLLNQWWVQTAKSEPYQVLWEIFNKHISMSFGRDSVKNSATEIVELVNNISQNSNTKNSYEYFLYMLNKHLLKFPNQWSRIRGRIYTKLSPHKINELSDAGLFNIALLFLSLSSSINITELTEKLSSLLLSLTLERQRNPLVLNIQMSVVVVHALRGFSVKEVCSPLLQFVQQTADNRDMFHLIRLYIYGFDGVLNASQNFDLGQHILIGSWVAKYMSCCQYNDLCYFLNVLLCSVKRVRNAGASVEWENTLKQFILPGLKPVAASSNPPTQVGELAALIDPNPSSDTVLTFTTDAIAPKVVNQFITMLLEGVEENYLMLKTHETAILHAWIRCCLLNCEGSDKLTQNVMKIGNLSMIIDTRTNINTNPLCYFIKSMSKLVSTDMSLRELCEQCFGRLDCWVGPHISAPSSEASAVHMYTCLALLVFHCSPLLYHKNRSSCLLNRIVNSFLLPTDILMGKLPHPYILNAVHRTWHLFVQGIYALDCSNDAYLERTLRDMVVRYVPLLPVANSPILKCLSNEKLAILILDRLSLCFLSYSSRSSDGNTTKALKIVQSALENCLSLGTTKLILQCTLIAIFEVIMFHACKNVAVDVVKYIAFSDNYEQLQECVKIAFVAVTEKHLAFNANIYFQFTNSLAKIIPGDILVFFSLITKQVTEVERMRGVGYDNILRQGCDRLKKLLNK